MNRLETWTVALLLLTAVAFYDLFSGLTVNGSVAGPVIGIGLFVGAIALYAAMVRAGVRDRKQIGATDADAKTQLGRAVRAVRWNGVFAVGFCVLLFANCSSIATTGPSARVSAAMSEAPDFLSLTAWVLAPLLLTLLLAPALTTAAQLLATSRPHTARRLAQVATWGAAMPAAAVVFTLPVGFFFGISACDLGTSAGSCAAGASSLMNLFSLGSLALVLPYVGLVNWALARMEADRAT